MLRTAIILAGLLTAASVNASECPPDRAALKEFLATLELKTAEPLTDGVGIKKNYTAEPKLRVLGVRPYDVSTQELWNEVGYLTFDFKDWTEQTPVVFQAAFHGAKCDDDSCEWKGTGEIASGELEFAFARQLYEGRAFLSCEYR